MCTRPKMIRTKNGLQIGKCGECAECMKERQNDIAHRLYLASRRSPDIHFFTLTYSNEKVPFYIKATDTMLRDCDLRHDYVVDYDRPKWSETKDDLDVRVAVPEFKDKSYIKTIDDDLTFEYLTPDNDLDTFSLKGEYIDDRKFAKSWSDQIRTNYFKSDPSRRCLPEVVDDIAFDNDYVTGEFSVCPSLRNDDVQKWIRKFRKGGRSKRTLSFKYYYQGEYGPKTDRPHYHLITYGLTDSQAEEMRREWVHMYGNEEIDQRKQLTTVSRVKVLDVDGKSHVSTAARYVAKYCTKGCFESANVKHHCAVKPRGCSSKNMYEITQRQFEIYSGKDLLEEQVIKYKMSDYWKMTSEKDKQFQIDNGIWRFLPQEMYTDDVLTLIKKRLTYTIPNDDNEYSLGKSVKNKILKCYYYEEQINKETGEITTKKLLRSTPLSLALSNYVRKRNSACLLEQYRQVRQEKPFLSDNEIIKQIRDLQEIAQEDRRHYVEKNYKNFLRKSAF